MKKIKSGCLVSTLLILLLGLGGCASQISGSGFGMSGSQNVFPMPSADNDIVGHVYRIKVASGETLDSIAQRYDVGALELRAANPGVNRLYEGQTLVIPSEYILPPEQFRKGIVINIAEMRLYYFNKNNNTVSTFPVAVGREGWSTPLTDTYVYRKEAAPTWHVPKSIRDAYFKQTGTPHPTTIAPGPDNPLGEYAIYLHLNGYLIHGTNNPPSIGRSVSSGCVRMYNADVAQLFQYVNRGTPVSIIYYPDKIGWLNGKLYVEAQQPLHSFQAGDSANQITLDQAVANALKQHPVTVNWSKVHAAIKQHRGIPVEIG